MLIFFLDVMPGNSKSEPEKKKKDDGLICEICNLVLASRQHMSVHMDGVHRKLNRYRCKLCNFRTSYSGNLSRHKQSHRNGSIKSEKTKKSHKRAITSTTITSADDGEEAGISTRTRANILSTMEPYIILVDINNIPKLSALNGSTGLNGSGASENSNNSPVLHGSTGLNGSDASENSSDSTVKFIDLPSGSKGSNSPRMVKESQENKTNSGEISVDHLESKKNATLDERIESSEKPNDGGEYFGDGGKHKTAELDRDLFAANVLCFMKNNISGIKVTTPRFTAPYPFQDGSETGTSASDMIIDIDELYNPVLNFEKHSVSDATTISIDAVGDVQDKSEVTNIPDGDAKNNIKSSKDAYTYINQDILKFLQVDYNMLSSAVHKVKSIQQQKEKEIEPEADNDDQREKLAKEIEPETYDDEQQELEQVVRAIERETEQKDKEKETVDTEENQELTKQMEKIEGEPENETLEYWGVANLVGINPAIHRNIYSKVVDVRRIFLSRPSAYDFLCDQVFIGAPPMTESFPLLSDAYDVQIPSSAATMCLVDTYAVGLADPRMVVPATYQPEFDIDWSSADSIVKWKYVCNLNIYQRCAFLAFSTGIPYEFRASFCKLFCEPKDVCFQCQFWFYKKSDLLSHIEQHHPN